MALKMRFAAKLLLATTLLAGGGAGAYYGTTLGWPAVLQMTNGSPTELQADAAAQAEAATQSPAVALTESDLDAVASAWAEPAQSQSATPESSPTARTADLASTSAEPAISTTADSDRYAFTSAPKTSEKPVEPTQLETIESESQPTAAIDVDPVPSEAELQRTQTQQAENDAPSDEAVASDNAPTEQAATEAAIARGQEPREDATPIVANETAEPRPLNSLKADLPPPGDRARDAFRDQSASQSTDRYGLANSSASQPEAANKSSELVNPFGAKAPSDPPAASTPQSIEPLSPIPTENGGRLAELQPTGESSANFADRTPREANLDGGNEFRRSRQSATPDASLDRFGGQPPIANGQPTESESQLAAAEGAGQPGERALEGPQKPALEIQKFAPGEIQVGKPAKFVVQVRNVGTQAADNVTIRDEVPHGTRLVSTTPTAQNEGSQLVWQLGKLSPGEDRTVEMQLMPTTEGEIGSVATVAYSAQVSVKTRCTMPQLAIRMTAPNKVMVGQEQRVKIELRNPGSGDATGVMLFENIPQNVKHAAGPSLEFEIGTLRAGETRELELVLLAEKAGKTVNVLSARADANLQVQQQVEFEVIAPELTVAVNGPERRYLERPATYEVSVENPGTAPAHNVQIITKLPKGLRFVRANNMGEYNAADHAVYWSLAELPEGERGTVELVAMPIETGPHTLEVESSAGQGLSDQTQQQIVIDGLAAIMFELRDLEDPIEVGGETGYEIRVVNQGTKAATNVQVAVNLPPGMKVVSAEGETQHKSERGVLLFEPLAQLAPKADTVYRVRVQGNEAGDQRVTVEVNTDDLGQPIRREESTRVFGDE